MAVDLVWLLILCVLTLSSSIRHQQQKHNLLELSWTNRNLSSVPVDLDLKLQALDLSNNAIKQLSVLNLKALEKLDLSYNHLSFIQKGAFENLIHLHDMKLAMNFLYINILYNSKAFQNLFELKRLDISLNNLNNNAVGLYIHNAVSLEELTANGNSLTRLSPKLFANNKKLVHIDVENNNIVEIDEGTFEHLKKLSILNLARNNLVHICDFQLYQITFLNLSRNSVEFFLTNQNQQKYHLEILDLSYNNLLYFPVVPKRNRLKYLYLQYNKLGVLGLETSVSEAKILHRDITETKNLNEANNNNDMNLLILRYIDLSNNHFTEFDVASLNQLFSLETLNLSSNCLQNISHSMLTHVNKTEFSHKLLPSLQHVNLRNNQVKYLSRVFLKSFPKLDTLILTQNGVKLCGKKATISCMSFSGIESLKHLNLAENELKTIAPNTFANTKLASLNLAGNKHLFLGRDSLEGLQDSLESLSIAKINANSSHVYTPCLTKLRFLNVSHNRFENLPKSFICSPLEVLDIQNNSFTSLSFLSTNVFQELDLIYISNNAYNCCNTTWLSILNETHVSIADLDNAKCQYKSSDSITFHMLKNHTIQCKWEASTTGNNVWVFILLLILLIISAVVVALVKEMYNNGSFII